MLRSKKILIIDDDMRGGALLAKALNISYSATATNVLSGASGKKHLDNSSVDIVLLDLNLDGESGFDVLKEIKREKPELPVIMITAHNDISSAVKAIKMGAFDYLIKPLDTTQVASLIEKALQALIKGNSKTDTLMNEEIIFADNSAIKEVVLMSDRVAQSQATVLITGESGVGKELLARRIHLNSDRANNSFIAINCAAVPLELMESQFFGHEKGSFTGAIEQREGFFQTADKGTIFLDEVGDMDISMQAKLLRVLQSGHFRRVGSNTELKTDVRILAATSQDLGKMVKENAFREDLFYRLNVISLDIPPLRCRKTDIELLAANFIEALNKREGVKVKFGNDLIDYFKGYNWPGNVRELKNIIERVFLLRRGDTLTAEDLQGLHNMNSSEELIISKDCSLADLEEKHILNILELEKGNKTRAAKRLGISTQTLYNKLDKMKYPG